MSVLADARAPAVEPRPAFARWTGAWSHLNRRHALGLALAILLMSAIDLSTMADKLDKPGVLKVMVFDLFVAVSLFSITLLAWSAAVAGRPPGSAERMRALLMAVVASGVLSAAIVVPTMNATGIPEVWYELMGKKRPVPPLWLGILGNTVHLGLFAALFVIVAEVLQRRAATNAAVLAARREQAAVAHEVLESRLAAMQAQVEPQFLFNALVGIEALYRKDADAAAENLDRLIEYLRVALPRLREPGSTIAGEIDLVRAYLAVVTSLHGGRPALSVTVAEDCADARFYPMLLLPLVQRAVREPYDRLPESIRIGVQRVQGDVAIVTRIACGGGCVEDFELARVRERLKGLYGDRATLDCSELDGTATQFTLRVPATG
ncbi:MAG: sensor histidine kinase [Betaproteobacteria bacterium]